MKKLILKACAVVAMLSSVDAQVFTTVTNFSSGSSQTNQFNTNSGYEQNFAVDGQPNYPSGAWNTTDPYNGTNGSTSLVGFIANYTPLAPGGGNNSVYWGGYNVNANILPSITNPSIYYTFNSSVVSSNDSVSFTIDFAVLDIPNIFFPDRDYFGFSLQTLSGSNLASFTLNPFTGSSTNFLGIQWEQNGTNVVTNGTTFKGFEIQYGSLYRLTATAQGSLLDLSIGGITTQSGPGATGITNYAVVTNQSIITGGALSSTYTAADFRRASIDWELSSGNSSEPGANYMIVTATQVLSQLSVIPEPGTWAAGVGLLVLTAFAVRRRRLLAAK
jgi:hypothetical protein